MAILLEVCVDTLQGAEAAVQGGAGRIELCSSLSEGGLTPSAGLMRAAVALPVPVFAMIRPRGGLFHFTAADEGVMLADISAAREAGLAGVVLGVQGPDDGLNVGMLARLAQAAGPLGRTLHRVIDVVPDPLLALDQAIALPGKSGEFRAVWVQGKETGLGGGAGRQIRTSLSWDSDAVVHAMQRPRHSARAAARLALKKGLLERLRSGLKWFETKAWTDANFCNVRMRRNRIMARSRRRNGRCEFSPRLMSQRPVSCRSDAPRSLRAAP